MTICYVNSLAIYNFNDDKTRQNKFASMMTLVIRENFLLMKFINEFVALLP